MADLESKTSAWKRVKKNEREGQNFMALLNTSSFICIQKRSIFIFGKYMKQAFVSYMNNCLSDG